MKNIFYKYDCAGNTFILVKYQNDINYSDLAKKVCSSKVGIGADGVIVIKDDIRQVLFYNQDGTEALFCGNAVRAYLHYLDEHQGLNNKIVSFIFNNKVYKGKVVSKQPFLSKVILNRNNDINLLVKSKFNDYKDKIALPNIILFENKELKLYPLYVGVFHLVILNDTKNKNEDFLNEKQIIKLKDKLKDYYVDEPNIEIFNLKTEEITFYERGVGYTKTCGSGSIAVGVILELMGYLKNDYFKISDELVVYLKKDEIELIGNSKLLCWGKYLC